MAGGRGLKAPNLSPSSSKGKNKKSEASSKKVQRSKPFELPDHVLSTRERLRQALSLGIKFDDKKVKRWQSTDIQVSENALRVMSKFIGCISTELLQNHLIKDSISDILVALEGVLQSPRGQLLKEATNVSKSLFSSLKSSLCEYHIFGVIFCLSHLLCCPQVEVAIASAMSLKYIIIRISTWKNGNKELWRTFRETNAIESIICFLLEYEGTKTVQYFSEMVCLLKEILWRWPHSRYLVWSNCKLMHKLGMLCTTLELSDRNAILQLYSAIALCDDAAVAFAKCKEYVDYVLSNMVECLNKSMSDSTKIEALKLCQNLTADVDKNGTIDYGEFIAATIHLNKLEREEHLIAAFSYFGVLRSKEGCLSLPKLCRELIIQGIVDAMGGWRSSNARRVPADQVSLVMEACRAAKMTYWPGDHHAYFWKFEIIKLLLDLLLGNNSKLCKRQTFPSFEELRDAVYDNRTGITYLLWEILEGLVTNCEEDFCFRKPGESHYLDVLISCTCSIAVDGMLIRRRLQHASSGSFDTSETESTSKVVLHLLFSPCKYIASHARNVLTDVLRNNESKDHFTYLLDFLTAIAVQDYTVSPDNAQITQRLISFTCYSAIAEFQSQIIHKGGVKMLLTIVKRHLYSNKSSISHHPCNISIGRTEICCFRDHQSKEETDSLLLYSLQALSQLLPLTMHHHRKTSGEDNVSQSDQFEEYNRETYVGIFLQILNRACSCEVKWYASYCLSFFGFYGFPSRLGGRMTRALNEKEYTNLQLALSDKQYVGVHIVVLMVRCPQVLPHEICSRIKKISGDSSGVFLQHEIISSQEAHLSDHICRKTLDKLLEYGYTGFCEVDNDLVKPMKVIAKKCRLHSLLFLLQRKQPAWRSPLPRFDLAAALSPPGHMFSDVILEAKETVKSWNCSVCKLSMPHIHAHKVILSSSCAYVQALFQSGMKESSQEVIQVPVSWKALVKLVSWFYSGELPILNYTCTWFNMDKETQFNELSVYVELSWLAEFWCLDEVRKESIDVVLSCVKLNQNFPVQIIQIAMNLNQWQIVEASIHQLAPLFPKLSISNELEELDDVAEMLREGYVHHSQENHDYDCGD